MYCSGVHAAAQVMRPRSSRIRRRPVRGGSGCRRGRGRMVVGEGVQEGRAFGGVRERSRQVAHGDRLLGYRPNTTFAPTTTPRTSATANTREVDGGTTGTTRLVSGAHVCEVIERVGVTASPTIRARSLGDVENTARSRRSSPPCQTPQRRRRRFSHALPNSRAVATTDMLIEGRHFRADCPPRRSRPEVDRAELRTSRPGARPIAALLAVSAPPHTPVSCFQASLAGSTPRWGVLCRAGRRPHSGNDLVLSVTAIGSSARAPSHPRLARRGQRVVAHGRIGWSGAVLERFGRDVRHLRRSSTPTAPDADPGRGSSRGPRGDRHDRQPDGLIVDSPPRLPFRRRHRSPFGGHHAPADRWEAASFDADPWEGPHRRRGHTLRPPLPATPWFHVIGRHPRRVRHHRQTKYGHGWVSFDGAARARIVDAALAGVEKQIHDPDTLRAEPPTCPPGT